MVENRLKYEEWFYQSDYDLETAIDMFKSGRAVYCIYFADKIGLELSVSQYEFLFMLNKISVPTR